MRLEEDLVIRRSRPTMISAKYRAREERRRLLKISAGKLRRIEDPEASLCRSVLINNAVRRLQRENRDEKTRNYGLPMAGYLDDSSKENKASGNMMMETENLSKKRFGEELRGTELLTSKRQRHDDLDLQDDVFSDFYILPPTPRLLSHPEEPQLQENASSNLDNYHNRHDGVRMINNTSSNSLYITDDMSSLQCDQQATVMMDSTDIECEERICDFSRFTDPTNSLEERLVDMQSLEEHFDLTKFERNNNQSCGRAFHDIQTFHSLVPGLET